MTKSTLSYSNREKRCWHCSTLGTGSASWMWGVARVISPSSLPKPGPRLWASITRWRWSRSHGHIPDIEFVVADAADFSFTGPFDAVFSNAALHWVTEAEQAVVRMAQALKQGGRFVVELGGKGNIAAITRAVRDAIWEVLQVEVEYGRYYPSISEYSGLVERHGLLVRSAVLFDRPTKLEAGAQGLRNWIAMFDQGVMRNVPDDKKEQVIRKVEDKTRRILFVDGYWFADYRRLRMVAHKE